MDWTTGWQRTLGLPGEKQLLLSVDIMDSTGITWFKILVTGLFNWQNRKKIPKILGITRYNTIKI